MKLASAAYWRGWFLFLLSLLFFIGGAWGGWWPAGLEPIRLPQIQEVDPLDTIRWSSFLTIRVPVPLRVQPSRVDTSGLVVLLIGDSMAEWLRFRLARWLKGVKAKFYAVLWPSSNLIWWAKSDTLDTLLAALNPDYVLICLGGNELFIPRISQRKPYLQKILEKIGARPYVWIGPPNWAEDTGINALIAETVGPGRFFASYRLTYERLQDGAHPTPSSAYRWADSLAFYLRDSALVPINLLEIPPLGALSQPTRTWLLQPHAP